MYQTCVFHAVFLKNSAWTEFELVGPAYDERHDPN